MQEYLKKEIKHKKELIKELRSKIKKATTCEEVRSLGDTLEKVLEELEEAKAIYKGLQQMYSGEMVDGETVMEELKNNMDYKIYLTVG